MSDLTVTTFLSPHSGASCGGCRSTVNAFPVQKALSSLLYTAQWSGSSIKYLSYRSTKNHTIHYMCSCCCSGVLCHCAWGLNQSSQTGCLISCGLYHVPLSGGDNFRVLQAGVNISGMNSIQWGWEIVILICGCCIVWVGLVWHLYESVVAGNSALKLIVSWLVSGRSLGFMKLWPTRVLGEWLRKLMACHSEQWGVCGIARGFCFSPICPFPPVNESIPYRLIATSAILLFFRIEKWETHICMAITTWNQHDSWICSYI